MTMKMMKRGSQRWMPDQKEGIDQERQAEASRRALGAKVKREAFLDLSDLNLTTIPHEVFQCVNLRSLNISKNRLKTIPAGISRLPNLEVIVANSNDIISVANQIGDLKKLSSLDLSDNHLDQIPPALRGHKKLKGLSLSGNNIEHLPDKHCEFPLLQLLDLSHNSIKTFPDWVSKIPKLSQLDLSANELSILPESVGNFGSLLTLDLKGNKLTEIPPNIANLQSLKSLDIRSNPLTVLTSELGRLKGLVNLLVDEDELQSPPADILAQGTPAVLSYLRSLLDENAPVFPFQAKLVLVGQGNVGKTCLVNNLLELDVNAHQGKTEGVEVRKLLLPHPDGSGQNMTLAMWDFGGQEIQHATHQFFLTNRSLFFVLWNARQDVGKRGGNLQYWLEMIQARAQDSPIFLVATHCDQEPARVSLEYWQTQFPNIKGVFEVGNLSQVGVAQLKEALRQEAAKLPVMKDAWNRRWLNAKDAIKSIEKPYISPNEAWAEMKANGVEQDEFSVVAGRMHMLGDIVYFREIPGLKDTIVLNPEWLTKKVCSAVSSELVEKSSGVLTGEMLESIWPGEEHAVQEQLLNFMEQYDLSYRTESSREESIVVQALPDSPPSALWEKWKAVNEENRLQIKYRFKGSLPPGIPSWFIAREHRFTTNMHWRHGALLVDRSREHHALVELIDTAGDLYVTLSVRGPEPIKFFSILQDGFEETLSKYPGIEMERMVPCPGDLCGGECKFEYQLETLEKYRKRGKDSITCGNSLEEYEVTSLLYGITIPHEPTVTRFDEMVASIKVIEKATGQTKDELSKIGNDLREVIGFQQREFTKLFQAMQSQESAHCPSVFVIKPPNDGWTKNFLMSKAELQLCCEMPGCWHPVDSGGIYKISNPEQWFVKVAPYFRQLVKVLKVAAPVAGAAFELAAPDISKMFTANLKLSQELVKLIPEIGIDEETTIGGEAIERATGLAFQSLRELIISQDPYLTKTGLSKVLMPERNYLWLCPLHQTEVLGK